MKNFFRNPKIKKNMYVMALATAITIPSIVHTVEVEAASTSFKDISASYEHKAKIDLLVAEGVISGYTDGTFRPSEKVNRGQFAIFISRALNLPTPSKPQSFKDVGKTSASYEGIVKAQAVGIINGYTDGRFKPNDLITRNDMAIMLERALQYKATFSGTESLIYADRNSIGKTALASVERLTHYNIMGAYSETTNSFAPNVTGDRIATVLSIYQLMVTKSLISADKVLDEYPKGDIRNYSYPELINILGEWTVHKRAYPDGAITEIDVIAEMRSDFMNLPDGVPALRLTPKEFFATYEDYSEAPRLYSSYYPLVEYVAINGVSYRDSIYFPDIFANPDPMIIDFVVLGNVIPKPPKTAGEFLIDLPTKNKDVVTYQDGKVFMERMSDVVKKTVNNDYLVDVKSLFKDTNLVTVSSDGLTIKFRNKTVILTPNSNKASVNGQAVTLSTNVVVQNGVILVPFKSVADHLGVYWRVMDRVQRFELASYPLERGIRGWEE